MGNSQRNMKPGVRVDGEANDVGERAKGCDHTILHCVIDESAQKTLGGRVDSLFTGAEEYQNHRGRNEDITEEAPGQPHRHRSEQ